LKFLKNELIDKNKWEKFLLSNNFASPFQNPEFYEFFNSVPGFTANVYAVENQNEIKAVCLVTLQKEKGIKGFFSRRGIIYGGPIIEPDQGQALSELLKGISNDLKGKAIYLETRNFFDYSVHKVTFAENNWVFEPYLNYHLNCETEELVFANLNTNRKRQIKKAMNSGVELNEAINKEEVTEFYKILYNLYKTKIKKPLLPLEFFLKFLESKVGKILLVKYNSKIIGGIVCPIMENKAIYELYICGLDHEYKDQSPSVMATYAAIEYGFKNKLKYFDFMGAGKPDEDYGVRDFKGKFGGELVEHGRFIKVNNPLLFNFGKFALNAIKKLK